MENNELIKLIKHDAVDLEDGRVLYIMRYYSRNLYDKCTFRIDNKENWRSIITPLRDSDPAAMFRLSDIGIDGACDFDMKYAGRRLTRAMAFRLLALKFSPERVRRMDGFVNEEFYMYGNVTKPYQRKYVFEGKEYDILDVNMLPEGVWITHDKPREKTGPKRKLVF